MSETKSLVELIEIATFTTERLAGAVRDDLTVEETAALISMKNQVELIVTDLMVLHTLDPVPESDVYALQELLLKLHKAAAQI